jgi:hypothetical protein
MGVNGKKSGRTSSFSSLVRRYFRKPGKKRKSSYFSRTIEKLFHKKETIRSINPKKLAANIANKNLNPETESDHTANITEVFQPDKTPLIPHLNDKPEQNVTPVSIRSNHKPGRRSKPLQRLLRRIKKAFRKKKPVRVIDSQKLSANVLYKNPKAGTSLKPGKLEHDYTPHRKPHRHIRRKPNLLKFESEGSPLKKQTVEDNTLFLVRLRKIMSSIDLRAILNSLGLFILSYLFIYFLYQFATIVAASVYGIDSVLYYYEVYFPIGNASSLWTKSNIIAITLIGPLLCGSLSVILFRIIHLRTINHHILRLFLLWVAFQGAAHFLGAFVAGIITNLGFGYVANWMFMNVFFKILVSLIFLFVLSLAGYYSTNAAMSNLPHGKRKYENRVGAMLSTYIIPWLLGTLLLFLVRSPDRAPQHEYINAYDTIILASMVFAIMPMIFRRHLLKYSGKIRGNTVSLTKGLMVLLTAAIILIVFRLVLAHGIHFVINLDFGAGFYN